eukprot:TRINITY_DN14399_c0_g1_i2.p3 TRINITY_DN14399_c0_g1~~TRINITY_DN14399_c0_g1_i2.p3  ORF type:complete len:105 (-),score=21.89 TRINITY_DN14399_c0_g1_i2:6-320(-)
MHTSEERALCIAQQLPRFEAYVASLAQEEQLEWELLMLLFRYHVSASRRFANEAALFALRETRLRETIAQHEKSTRDVLELRWAAGVLLHHEAGGRSTASSPLP